MRRYEVVIIGGGHNGLAAGCYLARAGLSVLIIERYERTGGACVTEELFPGFRLNTASYTIGMLQPETIDELDLASFGYQAYLRDPQSVSVFPDGRYLAFYPDDARTVAEVRKFSARDADAILRFHADLSVIGRVSRAYYMRPPTDWTWGDFAAEFRTPEEQRIFQQFALGSLRDLLDAYFESEPVKGSQILSLSANFVSTTTPGSAFLKSFHGSARVGDALGCFGYIKGGMGALSGALEAAFRHHGGEVWTSRAVESVRIERGKAVGVVLENGDEVEASIVLSNADPRATLLGLVGRQHLPAGVAGRIEQYRIDSYSYKINCALDALPRFAAFPTRDQEAHLRGGVVILPSIDYMERSYQTAISGRWSKRPYVIIHFQSITDPGLAPLGKHTMTLAGDGAPYRLAEGPWTAERRRAFVDDVLDTVAEYAPNVRDVLRDYQLLIPPDVERRFGMTGGHVLHGDHTIGQMLSFRPIAGYGAYRMPVANLYLCGSGAHPGGYVSCTPGRNAAQVVLADLNRR